VLFRDGSMSGTSAAAVIKSQLLSDPVAYLRSSYASWVIMSKAVTKAAAHVLQCVHAADSAAILFANNTVDL
jgi:hypothetical protein